MKKSLVKNSIYNILYKVITALYPLIAVTYVSHILLSDKMGMVSYAQNIVSYFSVIAALGIPTYGIREIAVKSDSKAERSQLFWELFLINAISTTIALIIYIILVVNVNKFISHIELYFIAGLQIVFNYLNVDWFYQGMEEYRYISLRSIVVKLCALVALPITIHSPNDYLWYALIYCLAIAGNNIFNIVRINKYIGKPIRKLNLTVHMKTIAKLLIVSLAVEVYAMIDTTMLGFYCNDVVVGCYANAMKLTRVVNTMAAAIGAVLFPRLSLVFNNKDKEHFNSLVNNGIHIMLIIAIPASIGLIMCSESIILIFFGESFYDAIPILRILALMVPVVVCNTLMGGQILVATNQENKYAFTVIVAALVNVILNAIFIPRFGATSAAIASLISEIIDLMLYCLFAKKYVQLVFSKRYIISIAVPLMIYICLSLFLIPKFEISMIMNLIINITICIILYFGIGLTMKNEAMVMSFTKFKELLHIKNN